MGQAASPRAHLACGEASPLGRRQRPRSAGLITPQGRLGCGAAKTGRSRRRVGPIAANPNQGPHAKTSRPERRPSSSLTLATSRKLACPGRHLPGSPGSRPGPTACLGYRALEYRARDVRAFDIRALEIRAREIRAWEIRAWEIRAWEIRARESVPGNPCLGSRHAPASRGGRGLGGSANLAGDKADATRGYPCQPSGRCAHTEPA
jgi:hypothetical protein